MCCIIHNWFDNPLDKMSYLKFIIQVLFSAKCLKITQNVAFEFLNFGIFHQFLSY